LTAAVDELGHQIVSEAQETIDLTDAENVCLAEEAERVNLVPEPTIAADFKKAAFVSPGSTAAEVLRLETLLREATTLNKSLRAKLGSRAKSLLEPEPSKVPRSRASTAFEKYFDWSTAKQCLLVTPLTVFALVVVVTLTMALAPLLAKLVSKS
jgi:hypothetical protein